MMVVCDVDVNWHVTWHMWHSVLKVLLTCCHVFHCYFCSHLLWIWRSTYPHPTTLSMDPHASLRWWSIVEGTYINILLNRHPCLIPVTISVMLGHLQWYTVYVMESDHPDILPFFTIPHMLVSPPHLLYTLYSFCHIHEVICRGILVQDLWFWESFLVSYIIYLIKCVLNPIKWNTF